MTEPMSLLAKAIEAAAPYANAPAWASALSGPMRACGLVTANRIAMFVGQVVEESGDLRVLSEDLYYLAAAHIRETWPSHFADPGEAAPFIGRPQDLANFVYANRMGNGDAASGDGWRYRGRGLIQITGKTLYQMFAKAEPRAADPDWLTTLPGAAASACWFWTQPFPRPSLNSLADGWDIKTVTQRINGGLTGLTARAMACEAARRALDLPPAAPVESEADRLMDAELKTLGSLSAG